MNDLPKPFATKSAENGAEVVPRPENAWPVALPGFKVELFASGLDNPRLMRTAPNGDIFLAEMHAGRIRVFRGDDCRWEAGAVGDFRNRVAAIHMESRFIRRGPNPRVGLYRQRDRTGALPVSQRRSEGERTAAAYGRFARRVGTTRGR